MLSLNQWDLRVIHSIKYEALLVFKTSYHFIEYLLIGEIFKNGIHSNIILESF